MKTRYFTKFCGITTQKDASNAQLAGCNALGFVFVKKSKRFIDVQKCRTIIDSLSPAIVTVALFANNSATEINNVLKQCPVHVLQFHGAESAEFCRQFNKPYWKAVPMADGVEPLDYQNKYADAQAYLIDNYGTNKSGGSGTSFDWNKLPKNLNQKWILAGGLNCSNISEARNITNLTCFDVSSGIEKSAGIKSKAKMNKFIQLLNE